MSSIRLFHKSPMSLSALLLVAGLGVTPLGVPAQSAVPRAVEHAASGAASGAYAALTDEHLRHLFHELMERIDETQRPKLVAVAKSAKVKLEEFEQRAQQARAPRRAIVLADVADLDALEAVRVAEMRVVEERSRYVDGLLVALAGVMTPAQRANFLSDIAATRR